MLFFQAVFSEPQSFLSLFRKCFCITLLFMFVYCNFHSHIVLTRNFLTQFLIIFNKVYYAIVISVPIFIVGIYTVLPFLPVFVYKDTAMLLVLAFFNMKLLWKYQILLVFTQEGFYMVRQVREIRESELTFFSASQKLGKHSRI